MIKWECGSCEHKNDHRVGACDECGEELSHPVPNFHQDVTFDVSDANEANTTGIAEYDGGFADFESIIVEIDYMREFLDRAEDMGWERIEMQVLDQILLFARGADDGEIDDFGVYPVLAPVMRDEMEDEDDG